MIPTRSFMPALMILLGILALGACTTPGPPQPPGPLAFDDLSRIGVDVQEFRVDRRYSPPGEAPHVDHLMTESPTAAIETWAQRRLRPDGRAGQGTVIIQEASLVREPLPRTEGIRGVFTRDQAERLTATINVRLEAQNPQRSGYVQARATRSMTLSEDASLAEREQAWSNLVERAIRSMDEQFVGSLRAEMSRFITE